MPASAAEFKSATRTDHAMLGFFHGVNVTFAAQNFPCGIFTQFFPGHGVIKGIGHCFECAAPSADGNGRFECFYRVGSMRDKRIHATFAVVKQINAGWNVFFVLGSFLEELHLTRPFCCFNITIIASKGYSVK